MVGAHLDSVLEGRASTTTARGTADILEIAGRWRKLQPKPRNKVRFAFWGAEEAGLIGSTYYVAT